MMRRSRLARWLPVLMGGGGAGLPDIIFEDGFESGDLTAWDVVQNDGTDMTVSEVAAMIGTYGMQITINAITAMYVRDNTPADEKIYKVQFCFDPNSITMADGDTFNILSLYPTTGTQIAVLELTYTAPNYTIRFRIYNDASSWEYSNYYNLTDGANVIGIEYRAATAAGANNGGYSLYLDYVKKQEVTNLDNDTRSVGAILLGAIQGVDATTSGTIFFDAFESRRTGDWTVLSP